MSYLSIKGITKSFTHQNVLQDMSIHIEEGEFVTLLGPSGCGKSTMLRIIAGLTNPDSGHIFIDGKDVTNVQPKKREIGMVFQSYALFPNMTVFENISFGLKMKKVNAKQINEKVNEVIHLVGLHGKENNYPKELSGGQQQRVALARSLVTEPKVLLLDEPMSALDAQIRKYLQQQIKSIQKKLNMTTILVTHDQEEAMTVSDKIYILNNGEITQVGTPYDIYTKPRNEFVARFIGHYNVLDLSQVQQLTNDLTIQGTLFAVRPEALTIDEPNDSYRLTGIVKNISLLGHVTRYDFESHGVVLKAEQLLQTDSVLESDEKRTLYLRKEDVISLQ
ncbi:ABC transporter ATP-binding protein [Bacillus alkalicellulosilyticus]|uniref:ABC transporter ATP-binding protein n=1 Tax=Alkalihalobacterium alkalicellulosilyticum TaxID=1912214 RepID=UPI000997D897|nr:ABC transporter ATP-binding protein [Bacillus alkalicellulosilyticus]